MNCVCVVLPIDCLLKLSSLKLELKEVISKYTFLAKCQIAKVRKSKINVSKKHVAKYVCLRGRGEKAGFNVIELD